MGLFVTSRHPLTKFVIRHNYLDFPVNAQTLVFKDGLCYPPGLPSCTKPLCQKVMQYRQIHPKKQDLKIIQNILFKDLH